MFIDSQDNEMLISHSHSTLSVLSRSDAVWALTTGTVRSDGGVWRVGRNMSYSVIHS